MSRGYRRAQRLALALVLWPGSHVALAQHTLDREALTAVRCAHYDKAWRDIVAKRGTAGLSAEFVARHDAFIANGCSQKPDVCPRSAAELEIANIMTIVAMNDGTASTFLPFGCPKWRVPRWARSKALATDPLSPLALQRGGEGGSSAALGQ